MRFYCRSAYREGIGSPPAWTRFFLLLWLLRLTVLAPISWVPASDIGWETWLGSSSLYGDFYSILSWVAVISLILIVVTGSKAPLQSPGVLRGPILGLQQQHAEVQLKCPSMVSHKQTKASIGEGRSGLKPLPRHVYPLSACTRGLSGAKTPGRGTVSLTL